VAKKDVIIPLVPAALSALLLAGGVTVFSACEQRADGSWMHCHQCQNMVAGSAVGLMALLVATVRRRSRARREAQRYGQRVRDRLESVVERGLSRPAAKVLDKHRVLQSALGL